MTSSAWRIRGAQLDLARQMETVKYICSFTDFLASHGGNALILYLEGRIRTPSFPWPADGECYDLDEMRQVVAHAAKRGVDVIPAVSNLGHCELFLRYPELRPLAELREGAPGRFQITGCADAPMSTFCPSLDDTYRFFDAYFREVAEVFPSQYFHAGCDENWDMCCCSLCREFARGEEKQSELFARHLTRTHGILSGRLGKTMMIWDDMLEYYPSSLRTIPRDIVMCTWLYDDVVDTPLGHFGHRKRQDKVGLYERLGFDHLVVPTARNSANTETLSAYTARNPSLGGFMSVWERGVDVMYELYPNIALACELWSSGRVLDAEAAADKALSKLFPSLTESDRNVLKMLIGRQPSSGHNDPRQLLRGLPSGAERGRWASNRVAYPALRDMAARAQTDTERLVLEDLQVRVEMENLHLRLRSLVPELYRRLNSPEPATRGELVPALEACRTEAQRLGMQRKRQWEQARPGLIPDRLAAHWQRCVDGIDRMLSLAGADGAGGETGLLRVAYCLPNMYASQQVRISVRYTDDAQAWIPVAQGVFKPETMSDGAFFEMSYPIAAARALAGCRIESWGYGGQGISYVEAMNRSGHFRPAALTSVVGRVQDPQNLLVDDLRWCWIGDPDADLAYYNMDLARVVHGMDLAMTVDS